MKFFVLFFLLWLTSFPSPLLASPVPKVIPLDAVVKMSSAAIEVEVLSGTQLENTNVATYRVKALKTYFGLLDVSDCFFGPLGLKIGRRYVVLVKNTGGKNECEKIKILGRRMPVAFEIDAMNEKNDYVRIDNRELVLPKIPGQLQVKQVWSEGGPNQNIIVLGTVAPLASFITTLEKLNAGFNMEN